MTYDTSSGDLAVPHDRTARAIERPSVLRVRLRRTGRR